MFRNVRPSESTHQRSRELAVRDDETIAPSFEREAKGREGDD
jgi:hypothetical protein